MAEDNKQSLKEMIVERLFLSEAPEDITDDADLKASFDLDSIKVFDLVIGLEEVFGISFEDDDDFDLESFTTVNKILEVMARKQGA